MSALELGEALEDEAIAIRVARNARRAARRETSHKINIKKYNDIADLFEQKSATMKKMQGIDNKMYPQLDIPQSVIWRISKVEHDSWILNPLDDRLSPKIPTGTLRFNILQEDPTSIYCFDPDDLFESKALREG